MTARAERPGDRHSRRIGIIGLGPRGLMVLERAIALAGRHPTIDVLVSIFEPNEPGCGSHLRSQPDYLRLNTIACQISVFPGPISKIEAQPHVGPSLFDWCVARDIFYQESKDRSRLPTKRPVKPGDFLPRRILGEYLRWFYDYLLTIAPKNMTVEVRRACAVDIKPGQGDNELLIVADDATLTAVDHVFVTVGHCTGPSQRETSTTRTARAAYPLPRSINGIPANAAVAIRGLGLTAMDVMVGLIDQWGGRFTQEPAGCVRYRRSGCEGKLRFITRHGRPYCARPATSTTRKAHEAWLMTEDEIERRLRAVSGGNPGFGDAILPLMRLEMVVAYYASCAHLQRNRSNVPRSEDIGPLIREAWRGRELAPTLRLLELDFGKFDPDEHLGLHAPMRLRPSDHHKWFRTYMARDILESRRGLMQSPLKAALEVWRDLRDVLRSIIDNRRFTGAEREEFFRDHAPMINRLVAGPQWERSAEFICLLDEGIAELAVEDLAARVDGPDRAQSTPVPPPSANGWPCQVEYAVDAYLRPSGLTRDDTPLLRKLAERGMVCGLDGANLDGVRVTAFGNAIGMDGSVNRRLWILGPPAEGSTYYNHYVPSPGEPSRAYVDAHRAVSRCFAAAHMSGTWSPTVDYIENDHKEAAATNIW